MTEKNEKIVVIELKLRKRHPKKSFRIGTHVVGINFAPFKMNEAEIKELKSVGCKTWLISKEEFNVSKKKAPAKDKK